MKKALDSVKCLGANVFTMKKKQNIFNYYHTDKFVCLNYPEKVNGYTSKGIQFKEACSIIRNEIKLPVLCTGKQLSI
jgi:hypothetical protein